MESTTVAHRRNLRAVEKGSRTARHREGCSSGNARRPGIAILIVCIYLPPSLSVKGLTRGIVILCILYIYIYIHIYIYICHIHTYKISAPASSSAFAVCRYACRLELYCSFVRSVRTTESMLLRSYTIRKNTIIRHFFLKRSSCANRCCAPIQKKIIRHFAMKWSPCARVKNFSIRKTNRACSQHCSFS